MRRWRVQTRVWRRNVKRRFAEWDGAFGVDGEEAFFSGWDEVGEPDFKSCEFCPTTAWWLAELCRTAYTPDWKELPRDRKNQLPHRENFLEERTPFVEVESFHKTGNHASLYRLANGSDGTILCFRGTKKTRQWIMNTVIRPHGWRRFRLEGDPDEAFVHSGFYVFFKRIWPLILPHLERLPRPWIFTGHSLGGALAQIAGAVAHPDLLCTFGMPKTGNEEFHRLRNAERIWRVVNDTDLVPRLPLPDPRTGQRQLRHGTPAILLDAEGSVSTREDGSIEDELPFPLRKLAGEFQGPPPWLRNHRTGEYCRKLLRLTDWQRG